VDLKDLEGRLTVVLTPELRALARTYVHAIGVPEERDRVDLLTWFSDEETPDGYVLDAARSEAEALMVLTIARVIVDLATPAELDDSDLEAEEAVRTLSRY
jgi:hypothetical protein